MAKKRVVLQITQAAKERIERIAEETGLGRSIVADALLRAPAAKDASGVVQDVLDTDVAIAERWGR